VTCLEVTALGSKVVLSEVSPPQSEKEEDRREAGATKSHPAQDAVDGADL
jgi:hypothetical protein